MAKIDINWLDDEVVKDLVNNAEDLTAYISAVEREIDALCVTQGNTALDNVPLTEAPDPVGFYLSPILQVLSIMKLKKAIFDGYRGSSSGNGDDIYADKGVNNEELVKDIDKWENRITYNSIRVEPTVASSSQALSRSIPIGG